MPRDFFCVMHARHPERRSREGSSYFFLKLAIANTSEIAIPMCGM
jgi:hypothetical protein